MKFKVLLLVLVCSAGTTIFSEELKAAPPKPYYAASAETLYFLTAELGAMLPLVSPQPIHGVYKLQFESFFRYIPNSKIAGYIGISMDFYPPSRPSYRFIAWQFHLGLGGYVFDRRSPKGIGWNMVMAGALSGGMDSIGAFFGARLNLRASYFFHPALGFTFGPSFDYHYSDSSTHLFQVGFSIGFSFSHNIRAWVKRLKTEE